MLDVLQHLVGQGRGGNLIELLVPVIFVAIYGLIALANRSLSKRGQEPSERGETSEPARYRPPDKRGQTAASSRRPVPSGPARRLPYAKQGHTSGQPAGPGPSQPARPQRVPDTGREAPRVPTISSDTAQRARQRQTVMEQQLAAAQEVRLQAERQAKAIAAKAAPSATRPQPAAVAKEAVSAQRSEATKPLAGQLLAALRRPATVRAAILYAEILGPCVALRNEPGFTGPTGW